MCDVFMYDDVIMCYQTSKHQTSKHQPINPSNIKHQKIKTSNDQTSIIAINFKTV